MLYLPDCAACLIIGVNQHRPWEYVPYDVPDDLIHGEIMHNAGDTYGEDGATSTCNWVNDDCPAQCRMEHDEPDITGWSDGTFTCPDTRDRYRYCEPCGGWDSMSWCGDIPCRIDDTWYCDPCEHGMTTCENCEEWVREDSTRRIARTWENIYVCRDCYDEHQEGRREELGGRVGLCRTCNTTNNWLDVLTEEFVCECKADALRAAKKPVLVAA